MARCTKHSAQEGTASGAVAGSGRGKHGYVWLAMAALLALGGTVGAVFAATAVGNNAHRESRRSFAASSAQVASTLQLAIQHEEDLVVSDSAYFLNNQTASNADFHAWNLSMRAFDRYPELQGIGIAVLVDPSQLPALAARAVADPEHLPLAADGTFQVVPPGTRPFYCLGPVGQTRSEALDFPAGFDFCAADKGVGFFGIRDSGQGTYLPLKVGPSTLLGVDVPVYRGGVTPTTVEARRAAFFGWVGLLTSPTVLLDRALQGHPGTEVAMHYHAGSSDVTFTSTASVESTHSMMTDLNNGWTATTFGSVAGGGVFATSASMGILFGGIALSLLLAALILILSTGRARALALVGKKTGELRHQALHDALTGLPNRALIIDRIEQLLARNRRHGTSGAALFVDLDGFKDVNDTLGHAAGDKLLQAVAARLTTSLRDADTIGRMGGDEFVVLIDGAETHGAPELVAQRLLDLMRQPFTLEESAIPIVITTSVGIAIGDRDTAGELLREADVAMYMAKAAGKNCFEVFRPEMETDVTHRYRLEFDLRSALDDHQFRLVYQPIYNLDDLTLVGVEALIRWEHPTLGQVQPDEFIPLLESSGHILDVGRWVLNEACTQMATWRTQGSDLMISVNVSGRQLDRDIIVDHVRDALTESGLDPAVLTLEVTETALMRNVDTTARRLHELKELGVQIAIDDFGTGYSSLAYLQRFPVDCLKIDRSFTNTITHSPEADAIIHTLVQLGKDLGLKTLAEGVESTGQMDHLRGEQVNEAQGFLMSRPLDPHTLETQLLQPARTTQPTPAA